MAEGNLIVLASPRKGVTKEAIITGTPNPGTVMQIDVSEAEVGGRFTYEAYNPGADGTRKPIAVLLEDDMQGKLATDAYVSGDVGKIYFPAPGEELNMLLQNAAGTGDSFAVGDVLIVDNGTGKLIATTGSPESEPFEVREAQAALTADTLVRCQYTGY